MEPVILAIAGAVAGKTTEGLVEGAKTLVVRLRKRLRERFADSDEHREALDAARDNPEDEAAVAALARRLDEVGMRDPELAPLLRELGEYLRPEQAGVNNTVIGNVSGHVTQARDVHGDINIGRP
jgi:hypothetical protein